MQMKPLKEWKKEEWSGVATVLLLFFGIPFLTWVTGRDTRRVAPPSPPTSVQPPPPAVADDFMPKRMTLEGKLICLPHAPGYPPTEECALGLHADDGSNYVIDFMLMSSIPESHQVGDRVTGNGVMTPIERLNTDHWRQYVVKGIFSVTDGFRVLAE